jgi:hypothetical protein
VSPAIGEVFVAINILLSKSSLQALYNLQPLQSSPKGPRYLIYYLKNKKSPVVTAQYFSDKVQTSAMLETILLLQNVHLFAAGLTLKG